MSRHIDADNFNEILCELIEDHRKDEFKTNYYYYLKALVDVREILKKMPTADVEEVRHGEWMTKEYMYDDVNGDYWQERPAESCDEAYCSLCGKFAGLNGAEDYERTPYCPYCGAAMKRKE